MPLKTTKESANMLPARTPARPLIAPYSALFEDVDGGDDSSPGPDWSRLVNAVRRYKWLVIAVTVVATGLGVVASRFLKPTYTAQATIWIDASDRRGTPTGALGASQAFGPEAWSNLLRSYAVLEGVVKEVRLDRTFTPPLPAAQAAGFELTAGSQPGAYRLRVDADGHNYTLSSARRVERGAVGDSVGRSFGFQWMPDSAVMQPGRDLGIGVSTPQDAARQLGEALQPRIDQEGNFLHIELSDTDPVRLAATLNAVARHYVDVAADLKRKKVIELTAILADQATYAGNSLAAAERELQQFRTRTALLPSGGAAPRGAAPTDGGYAALMARFDSTQRTRVALERIVEGPIDTAFTIGELDGIAVAEHATELSAALAELTTKRGELRTLRARYSDENPQVMKVLREVAMLDLETIPRLSQHVLAQLRRRESLLNGQVGAAAALLRDAPQRDLEESRLRRNVTLAENLYTALQQRYNEAQVAKASSVADVRILDVAAPPQLPSKNSAARIVLLAALAGLGVGLLAAVVLDRADKRFRYPEQVTRDLGLAILGAVPHLRTEHEVAAHPRRHSAFNEAMRDLRLNVAYTYGSPGPISLAVTSPGSEDGKSFLASHLARLFAESGRPTVLVDGDLRRGRLHRRFETERSPGMTEYLSGEADLGQIVRSTATAGLDLVTSGSRRSNAPELLGTQRMLQLIDELRARYEVVICDCPPLAAGIDAAVLGTATGHMLVVVRTGVSLREVAAAKLDTVARLPIVVLGAVLNDVPKGNVYSYYAHYTLPGYEAADERPGELAGRA